MIFFLSVREGAAWGGGEMRRVTLDNFYTTIAVAGTAVAILARDATNRRVIGPASILITARKSKAAANTGNVYVGNRKGQSEVLEPGDRLVIDVDRTEEVDLSDVFVDAATDGDGVAVTVKQS